MTQPIVVLLNRGGGTVARNPDIRKQVADAFRKAGVRTRIEMLDGDECAKRCRAVAKRGDRLIVVGGGDGTINSAAAELAGSKTILGVLPLGTLNHFARDLGLPDDLDEVAQLVAKGRTRQVDVAEINGRIFINNSAIGLYPLMVRDREAQQERLGRSKRLAMLVASARTLARFHRQRLTLTVNNKKAQVDTPLLFVGNNEYRLDIGAAGKRETLSDGVLSVFVMRKKTRRGLIAATIRALFNRVRDDDMIEIKGVERLKVDSSRSWIAVSLDGEVERLQPPLEYKVRKKALRVIAPGA